MPSLSYHCIIDREGNEEIVRLMGNEKELLKESREGNIKELIHSRKN